MKMKRKKVKLEWLENKNSYKPDGYVVLKNINMNLIALAIFLKTHWLFAVAASFVPHRGWGHLISVFLCLRKCNNQVAK